jgi:F1F0 ATPase subunit 2
MTDLLTLLLAWVAGGLLGAVFFGGLWWTVRGATSVKRPGLWLLGSLVVRSGIALSGFYFVSGGHWQRLLLCLLGFIMARLVVTRLTRPSSDNPTRPAPEASHAP